MKAKQISCSLAPVIQKKKLRLSNIFYKVSWYLYITYTHPFTQFHFT